MKKEILWGAVIIAYSIIIGILLLTKVIESGTGGGLFIGGLIIIMGIKMIVTWKKK